VAGIPGPVLVTGAAGFIGRRLVARLRAEGAPVTALALPDEVVPGPRDDGVRWLRGDVRDADAVARAVEGRATVFHLAAMVGATGSYDAHWSVTVEGSRNVYRAAAEQGARVVVTTSVCAYGDRVAHDVCREDGPRGPWQGPYGRAKQGQEDAAWEAREALGLDVVVLRPGNVYGVGSAHWVTGMLAGLRAGMLGLPGDGSGNAGLVQVENVVDALLLAAASQPAKGRVYNVCDGLDVTWGRYTSDLARIAGAAPPKPVPLAPLRQAALANEDPAALVPPRDPGVLPLEVLNLLGSDNRFDTARIRGELGWTPRVGYQAGLDEIASWVGAGH